jgi:hypothetical protein
MVMRDWTECPSLQTGASQVGSTTTGHSATVGACTQVLAPVRSGPLGRATHCPAAVNAGLFWGVSHGLMSRFQMFGGWSRFDWYLCTLRLD